ncbi:uncharacterized protein K452DRAFT_263263 [Aplosporella prunicola CBS 121167]|uniref:Uncharacterized protein n=1 Tax=Aplosporella prunicola CBS 121167 TaxID=1176127 RepID=A0A6A6BUU0_9PEZI|nr:uncharacterized protein K452DRAFT_263263 [Aplosporella prunicola CBS 121167]KAF2146984.1 hypothetical protein K452DRAFT_263263 [Aplosporella prunicola CBS 121167]
MEWTLPTINVPAPLSPVDAISLLSSREIRSAPPPRNTLVAFIYQASVAAFSQLQKLASGVHDLYGPEKPIPKDHIRVRWTCTCGAQLYDDYIERRPGAAREFETFLNRPQAHAPTSSSASTSSSPGSTNIWSGSSALATPSPATTCSSQGSSFSNSGYSPTAVRSSNPFLVRMVNPVQRWLLTCIEEGYLTTKLSHIDVTDPRVRSDKDLAMEIRKLYSHINRKWWRILRLRGLTSIKFVQFEAYRNRVVDIRKCPDMPPRSQHYDYDHAPDELIPPVGDKYLMHMFMHPEDHDSEVIAYARFPKKRGQKVEGGLAWGVHLVEGFLADRVWLLLMGFFVLGSIVFAVVWAVMRHGDVQGAFGVAAWLLTLAALVIGWAEASLG